MQSATSFQQAYICEIDLMFNEPNFGCCRRLSSEEYDLDICNILQLFQAQSIF